MKIISKGVQSIFNIIERFKIQFEEEFLTSQDFRFDEVVLLLDKSGILVHSHDGDYYMTVKYDVLESKFLEWFGGDDE